MAFTKDQIKANYPLPAYNYRVTVLGDLSGSSETVVLSAAKVSGLSMKLKTVTYKHGFSFLTGMDILPAMREEVNISIRKGIVKDASYFSDWMKTCYPIILPAPISQPKFRNIVIDLCDDQGLPVVRWTVKGAIPISLSAPEFDANSNEVAIEQLDLIAQELSIDYSP